MAVAAFVAVTLSCASSDPGGLTGTGRRGTGGGAGRTADNCARWKGNRANLTIDFVDCR